MKEDLRVSLKDLANGGTQEVFDYELARVLENIMDPNTTEKAREINIKVKIKPNKERDYCDVSIDCTSKLAQVDSISTHFYVGKTPNGIRAVEHNPQQMKLQMETKLEKETPPPPNIVPLKQGEQNDR